MPMNMQKMLADMIRSAGQELIDKANEIAGDPVGPWLNYKITIDISTDTDELSLPTIQVNRSFISNYAAQTKLKYYEHGEYDNG